MAKTHRIFVAFAIEDDTYRDFLVGQASNNQSPFSFTDMSVKEPWSNDWKSRCRTKIRGCDGGIALISQNTRNAEGARWEIGCIIGENIPLLPLKIHEDEDAPYIPELGSRRVYRWTWDTISSWLDKL